jgi:hypothetical protein
VKSSSGTTIGFFPWRQMSCRATYATWPSFAKRCLACRRRRLPKRAPPPVLSRHPPRPPARPCGPAPLPCTFRRDRLCRSRLSPWAMPLMATCTLRMMMKRMTMKRSAPAATARTPSSLESWRSPRICQRGRPGLTSPYFRTSRRWPPSHPCQRLPAASPCCAGRPRAPGPRPVQAPPRPRRRSLPCPDRLALQRTTGAHQLCPSERGAEHRARR